MIPPACSVSQVFRRYFLPLDCFMQLQKFKHKGAGFYVEYNAVEGLSCWQGLCVKGMTGRGGDMSGEKITLSSKKWGWDGFLGGQGVSAGIAGDAHPLLPERVAGLGGEGNNHWQCVCQRCMDKS
jgi:hypothetical protein